MYNLAMGTLLRDRLLLARRDLEIDQRELSRRSGISPAYISKIERGRSDNVTVDIVFRLASALGVSPAYLLGLADAPLMDDGAPIESSKDRISFDVRDAEMRAAVVEIVAILREMTPGQRRIFVEMAQKMQRLMESTNDKAPIIIGA